MAAWTRSPVADEAEAVRRRMTDSPTVLLDGVDPFAVPGAEPSVSCRLYRGANGRPLEGAPTVDDLGQALAAAGLPAGFPSDDVPSA
ncbi:hypothetical protein [Streptomyces sp. NPDC054794]